MQLSSKNTCCGLCTQCILREYRRSGKTKLVVLFELLFQVLLSLAKLRTVAFVKYKDHLLMIYRQITLTLHEVIQFLNSGYNNLIIILLNIALQTGCTLRTIHTIGRKPLILLHGLKVQILAIHYKKHLIDEIKLSSQTGSLKTCQSLTGTCGVPDITATFSS